MCRYICKRSLNSYTIENLIIKLKQQCIHKTITRIRTSLESQLHWKNHFHRNPQDLKIYADFEADNEKGESSIGNKITKMYKQNPVSNGYRIVSEIEDVLKSGYFKYALGYENVDWFVDEIIKLEQKMTLYFKNTKKDISMTQENKEDYEINNTCRFCEKAITDKKVRDHCHLTGIED